MPITYVKGDATLPGGSGIKFICHVCNDIGRWGKGFVLELSKRTRHPETYYKLWYKERDSDPASDGGKFALGSVQLVRSSGGGMSGVIYVANMIAQHGLRTGSNGPPIRYDALRTCLEKVAAKVQQYTQMHAPLPVTVHMPRIGCGLAGGSWDKVEPIIEETLTGVNVTVYDYEG